ncbi:MAG: methionyl-tRNA formyltransferase [Thermoguttaceae bacterium]
MHTGSKRLELMFLATGGFAVPSMQKLCDSGLFDITCLVTGVQKYDTKGHPIITPARQFAVDYQIPISDKHDVHSLEFFEFLYLMRPDLLFVCDFGQILPKRILEGSILGGVNLHGSLLPKYRGAAPIVWAILHGDAYSGVSIIHMTPQIDAGPVIAQSPPLPVRPRETALELEQRLSEYGADLVLETIKKMASNEPVRIIEQVHRQASKAPRLKKWDGFVPWAKSSLDVYNHFRAMTPWPRAYSDWTRADGSHLRIIFGDMIPLDDQLREVTVLDFGQSTYLPPTLTDAKMDNLAAMKEDEFQADDMMSEISQMNQSVRESWWKPGIVVRAEGDDLLIAAETGLLRILRLQPTGKRMMTPREFMQGHQIKKGDIFSSITESIHFNQHK